MSLMVTHPDGSLMWDPSIDKTFRWHGSFFDIEKGTSPTWGYKGSGMVVLNNNEIWLGTVQYNGTYLDGSTYCIISESGSLKTILPVAHSNVIEDYDGNVIAFGERNLRPQPARYFPDGTTDSTFIPYTSNQYAPVEYITPLPTGKYLHDGGGYTGFFILQTLGRYNADGTRDTSFTRQYENFSYSNIAADSGGRAYQVLQRPFPSPQRLYRYRNDGTLDSSVNWSPRLIRNSWNPSFFNFYLHWQDWPVYKLHVWGVFDRYDDASVGIVPWIRVDSDGAKDNLFQPENVIYTNMWIWAGKFYNDKFYFLGRFIRADGGIDHVISYNSNGTINTSFRPTNFRGSLIGGNEYNGEGSIDIKNDYIYVASMFKGTAQSPRSTRGLMKMDLYGNNVTDSTELRPTVFDISIGTLDNSLLYILPVKTDWWNNYTKPTGLIDWGDGSITAHVSEATLYTIGLTITHQYKEAGEYRITLTGAWPTLGISVLTLRIIDWGERFGEFNYTPYMSTFSFLGAGRLLSLPEVTGDDMSLIDDTFETNIFSMSATRLFRSSKLTSVPADLFKGSLIKSFYETFRGCLSLTVCPSTLFTNIRSSYYDWNLGYDVSALQNVAGMFYDCRFMTGNAPDIWNTLTNITDPANYYRCFYQCTSLNNYADIPAGWK